MVAIHFENHAKHTNAAWRKYVGFGCEKSTAYNKHGAYVVKQELAGSTHCSNQASHYVTLTGRWMLWPVLKYMKAHQYFNEITNLICRLYSIMGLRLCMPPSWVISFSSDIHFKFTYLIYSVVELFLKGFVPSGNALLAYSQRLFYFLSLNMLLLRIDMVKHKDHIIRITPFLSICFASSYLEYSFLWLSDYKRKTVWCFCEVQYSESYCLSV